MIQIHKVTQIFTDYFKSVRPAAKIQKMMKKKGLQFSIGFYGWLFFWAGYCQAQNILPQQSQQLAQKFITKDTIFKAPYIDIDEWREKPVRHRYLHGGFAGTETRFSLYFPEKSHYQGRFFQYITPFPDNEFLSQGATGEEDKISFSISSGAYFVETNGGGKVDFSKPSFNSDPTIGAFRANAATASFSKIVASEIFGKHRTYGYAFGGSGGAYRTIGSIENTDGVWDGVVPYVLGSPMAIPNVFAVRMNAMRILDKKLPQIIDALDAGGSGDMYAGLNEEEKEALREATKLGFPAQSWFGYKTMGIHGFIALYQGMRMADAKFFEDFWRVEGYLGANPTESLLKARLQKVSKIKAGITIDEAVKLGLKEPETAGERGSADLAWKSMGGVEGKMPVAFQIEDILPDVNFMGGDLVIKTGAAAGKTLQLATILGDKIVFGPVDLSVLAKIKVGDEVFIDNSNFLAVQTYHRHQVPGREYKVWDYWRDANGNPKYPQRSLLLGPLFTRGAAGVLPTGNFKGKMIVLCSLWDREAFAWQGDFYREKVKSHLGDKTDENFRLWYTDRALHGDLSKQEYPTRTVSYLGVLQQALRDLSAWCEKGIIPAASTNYKIEDGQVVVPTTASERRGIQPVVNLTINGEKKANTKAGQTASFEAVVEVPLHTGKIVAAEWDFEGKDSFPIKSEKIVFDEKTGRATLKMTYKFTKSGTYFPTLRVASQRNGDAKTPFARIPNLDRVRVVVE
ncbi:PKD domain-containing protein [Runella rosea]|uniref:PKD domain-containing protein n=1 Tax=Runella rosea TaxID=2259595 RepID=UPI00196669B9|nr:PKD domain-containing protein [Runella rosea]